MGGLLALIVTNMKMSVNPQDNKKQYKVMFSPISKTEMQIIHITNWSDESSASKGLFLLFLLLLWDPFA